MSASTLLALSLIFLLAGCGGPTAADYGLPAGIDPDDPEAGRMAVEHMLDTVYETDVDDELLAELLDTHRRVRAAGDDVRRAMAVLAGTRWNGKRYGKAMWKWKMMQEATKKGLDAIQRDIDDLDEQRARLEAAIAEASGAQREELERGLARHAVGASVMRNNAEALKELAMPEIEALVRKWKPRFDAVDAEYD